MEKIKFAVIGTSKITENFLDAAKLHECFELRAVYSRDLKNAISFGEKYGATIFFDDLEKFASSQEFDAVYIASPNSFHCEQSIYMLKNKKHVLCEKAFALNLEEVDKMINASKENKVLLVEAMRSTSSPGFLAVKENLYKIGEIRRYFASFCQYSSRYDAYKEKGIIPNIFKKEMGAGSLMDIGVYTIAPMVNLFGSPLNITSNAYLLETGIDGQGSASFDYGTFEGNIMHSKISNSTLGIEIQGENGVIVADNIRFSNVKIIYRDGTQEIIYKEELENDMFYELDDFIRSIKDGKIESEINTLSNSRKVIELLEIIRKQTGIKFLVDID